MREGLGHKILIRDDMDRILTNFTVKFNLLKCSERHTLCIKQPYALVKCWAIRPDDSIFLLGIAVNKLPDYVYCTFWRGLV